MSDARLFNFVLRTPDGAEPLQCDSCDFPAPTAEFDWGPPFSQELERPKRLLCEFCCSTLASRHTEYPASDLFDRNRAEIWKAAANVFNMLKHGNVS